MSCRNKELRRFEAYVILSAMKKIPKKSSLKRLPPVKIPLSFDQAVSGLLAVKPDAKPKPSKKKKPARKK